MVETHLSAYDTEDGDSRIFQYRALAKPGRGVRHVRRQSPRIRARRSWSALSVVAVLLLAGMLWRIDRLDTPSAAGLALIFGGAMGNVFDRVRAGSVTDFLDFYAGTYHWYTFNVADASICTGAGLLILSMLLSQRNARRAPENPAPDMFPRSDPDRKFLPAHLRRAGGAGVSGRAGDGFAFREAARPQQRENRQPGRLLRAGGNAGGQAADDRARSRILRSHPGEIFSLATLQSAGIFFGGFILALVFAFFYMRAQNLPVLATSDLFAPGLAIGHGIGRLGCFAAGCCWGKPTHLPWAVTFTNTNATTGVPLGIPLHPTQLYEAFAEGIICLILVAQLRRPHRDGQIIGLYARALRMRAFRGGVPARARFVESVAAARSRWNSGFRWRSPRGGVSSRPPRANLARHGARHYLISSTSCLPSQGQAATMAGTMAGRPSSPAGVSRPPARRRHPSRQCRYSRAADRPSMRRSAPTRCSPFWSRCSVGWAETFSCFIGKRQRENSLA